MRIGSAKQHVYVTYLIYHMLILSGTDVLERDFELFNRLREGISERITKVGTVSEAGYHQGLLLWKLYVQSVGLDQEEDSDCVDLSNVTAEEVFYSFTDETAKIVQTKIQSKADKAVKEESKETMYAEVDSDNDSDFDVKYEQVVDTYDDLKTIHQPMFISDLILGL